MIDRLNAKLDRALRRGRISEDEYYEYSSLLSAADDAAGYVDGRGYDDDPNGYWQYFTACDRVKSFLESKGV
jgi:hypothetical protein